MWLRIQKPMLLRQGIVGVAFLICREGFEDSSLLYALPFPF